MAYVRLLNVIASINLELAFNFCVWFFRQIISFEKTGNKKKFAGGEERKKKFFEIGAQFFVNLHDWRITFWFDGKNELCGDWAYYEMLVVAEADQLYMRIGLEGFWPSKVFERILSSLDDVLVHTEL